MAETEQSREQWVRAALERYERPLVRYAMRYTRDLETARDVVQDTFLKLCVADREKVQDRLAAWLFTVCRNRAIDVAKKEGRMGALENPQRVADRPSGSPGEIAARNEAQKLVLTAVSKLPEDQKEAFELKFKDHLTYREISQATGKSLGSVSRLITAALGSVREQIGAGLDLAQEA